MTVLFTAADLAEMAAFNDANLPHTAKLWRGVRAYEPGGTRGGITWDINELWSEPARFSPASAPQEQLSAGALQVTAEHVVVMRAGVSIPGDVGDTYYKLVIEHDLTEIASPLTLYNVKVQTRSYRALTKCIGSTVAPQ